MDNLKKNSASWTSRQLLPLLHNPLKKHKRALEIKTPPFPKQPSVPFYHQLISSSAPPGWTNGSHLCCHLPGDCSWALPPSYHSTPPPQCSLLVPQNNLITKAWNQRDWKFEHLKEYHILQAFFLDPPPPQILVFCPAPAQWWQEHNRKWRQMHWLALKQLTKNSRSCRRVCSELHFPGYNCF